VAYKKGETYLLQIWLKLSIRDLHKILLSICDPRENRRRVGPYFLMCINENTFMQMCTNVPKSLVAYLKF